MTKITVNTKLAIPWPFGKSYISNLLLFVPFQNFGQLYFRRFDALSILIFGEMIVAGFL